MPIRISANGLKIKELRERADLSQGELAQKTGVSQPQIARIESGARTTRATLNRIAAFFGVLSGDLLGAEITTQDPQSKSDIYNKPEQARLSHPSYRAQDPFLMSGKEEAEMRVARLCAAVHNVIKKEDPEIEIIIVSAAKKAVPDLFEHWAESAAKEIGEVRDVLTRTLTRIRRRRGR